MDGIRTDVVLEALAAMADARQRLAHTDSALAHRVAEAEGRLRGSLMLALPGRVALADAA